MQTATNMRQLHKFKDGYVRKLNEWKALAKTYIVFFVIHKLLNYLQEMVFIVTLGLEIITVQHQNHGIWETINFVKM